MYVQSDALLLADVLKNFKSMCINIYKTDPAKLLSAAGLTWQAVLKKIKVILDLLTDINMLLMVEKGIRGGIGSSVYWFAKANNKYIKSYDKNKEPFYIQHWDVNNLYGWRMSQKLPLNNFEWIIDTSQVNEDFIKNYNEVMKDIFLKLMFNILKNYMNFIMIYHF